MQGPVIRMGDVNAFENDGQPTDKVPGNLFETIQRQLPDEDVNAAVQQVLFDLPPNDEEVAGIEKNIEKLKGLGLWATARFYERLLEKRDSGRG